MGHLPDLIADLALILMAGAVVTLIFRKIKQPLVLGYIIAGFIVGPHFDLLPTVVDNDNIETWAEIGVIFLLFGLGLEFSFKKLLNVGGSASVTAFVEIIFITVAGYAAGKWMGWSTMDSLFLGGMLASSSTTIIIRAFDELGVKTQRFAQIVFGVLVVEDIVVILLMVLLSTIAVTQQFEGGEIVFTILKLLFFLVLWFLGGIFLLPTFLKRAKKLLDEETTLILSIGLCLAMVVIATQVGFSAELGAFIMGSIIAETTSAEKVEHITKPVKNLFGAVFFISVGMMIEPRAFLEYGWPVLIVTLLTLFGKLFSTTFGALLSGQPLKQSMQVGMSMAQIGEFAFIVATLGLSLGVISEFLFPVAVGASVITTFTTPYLIKLSGPLYDFMERKLPEKWLKTLNNYSSGTNRIQADSDWKVLYKSYATIVFTNGIVFLAIFLLTLTYLVPFLTGKVENEILRNVLILVISLGVATPFLWALMAKRPRNMAYKELWLDKRYNRGPLIIVEILRILLGVLLIGLLVLQLFSIEITILVVIPIVFIGFFIFSKRIQKFHQRIEGRFMSNLNERESEAEKKPENILRKKNEDFQSYLLPWDAHIVEMEVVQEAEYAGKTLAELNWRKTFGINVVYIKRGDKLIHIPGPKNRLFPYDQVGIIATDAQLQEFKPIFTATENGGSADIDINDIVLKKIVVDEHTQLNGVELQNSGIRKKTNGIIIGIERDQERILNPDPTEVFEWGDIVWIVGERKRIQKFNRGNIR
ncbi:MAG TPA: cation:proton antiporter [Flavobacteriaceae bacterium]|nr:cation:proton antiporter [Flavobacteriaceae bacterium]